jgi:hypothetical protein
MHISYKYWMAFFLSTSLLFSSSAFADDKEDEQMKALKEWIRQKRLVTIKELGGELAISGETRVEGQWVSEKKAGIKQRGSHSATDKPEYGWDVEVNLMFDYRTERTWTSIKLEFDNDMGIFSGTVDHLNLERAYLGGRIYQRDTFTFDVELGRRPMNNVFDSDIEFNSRLDGVVFKFNKAFESIGNMYFNMAPFIVDDHYDHYGVVGELGFLRIANTPFYVKYSLIDWKKHCANEVQNLYFNYLNSQWMLGYQYIIPSINKLVDFYGAVLCNHLAKKIPLTHNKKMNWAGYVGVDFGQIKKQGDWAVMLTFQYVEPQAIPDFDVSGIKRGNAEGVGLYTVNIKKNNGTPTTRLDAVGSCNYKGFVLDLLYAITDNLTLYQSLEMSENIKKTLGPMIYYKKYELELIYGF